MSFRDEWASIRAEVKDDAQSRMNLAGLAPEHDGKGNTVRPELPGGFLHTFKVPSAELRSKATKIDQIRGNLKSSDNKAIQSMRTAASSLKGFESQDALKVFERRWEGQMRFLDSVFGDGIAAPMRKAATGFDAADKKQGEEFKKGD